MKQTLLQITQDYQQLMDLLEQSGGELTPEIEQQITITQKDLQEKALNYIEVIGQRVTVNNRIDLEVSSLSGQIISSGNFLEEKINQLSGA